MCNPPVIFNKLYPKHVNLIGVARNQRRPCLTNLWLLTLREWKMSWCSLLGQCFWGPSTKVIFSTSHYCPKLRRQNCFFPDKNDLYNGTKKRYHLNAIWLQQSLSLSCWEVNQGSSEQSLHRRPEQKKINKNNNENKNNNKNNDNNNKDNNNNDNNLIAVDEEPSVLRRSLLSSNVERSDTL